MRFADPTNNITGSANAFHAALCLNTEHTHLLDPGYWDEISINHSNLK